MLFCLYLHQTISPPGCSTTEVIKEFAWWRLMPMPMAVLAVLDKISLGIIKICSEVLSLGISKLSSSKLGSLSVVSDAKSMLTVSDLALTQTVGFSSFFRLSDLYATNSNIPSTLPINIFRSVIWSWIKASSSKLSSVILNLLDSRLLFRRSISKLAQNKPW